MNRGGEMVERATAGEAARASLRRGGCGWKPVGSDSTIAVRRIEPVVRSRPGGDPRRLASLAHLPPSEWPARVVRRPDVAEPLYMIPVDGGWRVLISAPAGQDPEVVDIVHHETLCQFAGAR